MQAAHHYEHGALAVDACGLGSSLCLEQHAGVHALRGQGRKSDFCRQDTSRHGYRSNPGLLSRNDHDCLYEHKWKEGAKETEATVREMRRKAKQIGPAYNKGALQYLPKGINAAAQPQESLAEAHELFVLRMQGL